MGEFLERYGEHTAIAALAVIVEDEELDKKRIIHDATHGVHVNHRIKCRDKLRSPGAREKKHLLREHEEEGEAAFSVVGDIAKAHPFGLTPWQGWVVGKVGVWNILCWSLRGSRASLVHPFCLTPF